MGYASPETPEEVEKARVFDAGFDGGWREALEAAELAVYRLKDKFGPGDLHLVIDDAAGAIRALHEKKSELASPVE